MNVRSVPVWGLSVISQKCDFESLFKSADEAMYEAKIMAAIAIVRRCWMNKENSC